MTKVQIVSDWFGVKEGGWREGWAKKSCPAPLPGGREIVLITGPSGAGKSSVLRRVARRIPKRQRVDLAAVRLPAEPVVECFPDWSVERTLGLLSRVGLAEAHTYLLRPARLSEGQRWRLKLALCLARGEKAGESSCLICDEFAALLDRVTACVVARVLRTGVDAGGMRAVVATSREDLADALRPDWVVRCDFGKVEVERGEGTTDERG